MTLAYVSAAASLDLLNASMALAFSARFASIASFRSISSTAYGITGVFGILITTHNLPQYLISIAVAFVVAFLVTVVIYRDQKEEAHA